MQTLVTLIPFILIEALLLLVYKQQRASEWHDYIAGRRGMRVARNYGERS